MRKSIKFFITIFALVIMLTTEVHATVNVPVATPEFYVNDFADVFTSAEKERIIEKARALSDEHDGVQVVITTIVSLDGNSIEDYAYDMYNQYGIGKNDMGILILLATNDREIRVEVGKSMEAYINDSKAGRFIDQYAIPYLKDNKFNEGLISLQEALIDNIILSIENNNVESSKPSDSEDKDFLLNIAGIGIIIPVIILLIGFIVKLINKIRDKYRTKKEEVANLYTKIENLKNDLEMKETSLTKQNHRLSDLNKKLQQDYQNLDSKYRALYDRYERAKKLYPTVEAEITDMIAMEKAQNADVIIAQVINLTASKEYVTEITNALNCYNNLTREQKSYVKSDITKLKGLYDESLKLKTEHDRKVKEDRDKECAAKAAKEISAVISAISIGRASHLSLLKSAKSIYENLDSDARGYFDQSILDRLNELYSQAKRDKDNKYEEERRSYNRSYSSLSRGSTFGHRTYGGGGRSGGGGASRRF